MKKKLIISTVAMTVMLGFNKLAFADSIDNIQNYNQEQATYSTGYINATRVNFREKASTDSEVYRVLDKYTDVIILGQEGNWTKVDINDTVGYVYGKYVTKHNNDVDISNIDESNVTRSNVPLQVLVPAFAISELKTAFQIGFLIYLPFLLIDLVVSSTLMAMGMFMLPPAMISLPFKLLLFIMVDGWNLLIKSLILSFN